VGGRLCACGGRGQEKCLELKPVPAKHSCVLCWQAAQKISAKGKSIWKEAWR
jgi:hypothetical protein